MSPRPGATREGLGWPARESPSSSAPVGEVPPPPLHAPKDGAQCQLIPEWWLQLLTATRWPTRANHVLPRNRGCRSISSLRSLPPAGRLSLWSPGGLRGTQHLCRQDARHVASTLPPSSFVQCGSEAGRLAGHRQREGGGSSSPGPTDTPSPRGHSHRGEQTWYRAEGRQRKPSAPGAKAERSSQLRWASKQKGVVSGRTWAGEGAGWTLEAGDHVGTVGSCRRQLATRPPLPPW